MGRVSLRLSDTNPPVKAAAACPGPLRCSEFWAPGRRFLARRGFGPSRVWATAQTPGKGQKEGAGAQRPRG